MSVKDLEDLAARDPWPQRDLSNLLSEHEASRRDIDIDDAAIFQLDSAIKQQEIQRTKGDADVSESGGNLSLPFLLQLNITRFGTLTLVGIGIGIFAPLYRFAARLSAFYRARADAIRLQRTVYKQQATSFVRLSGILTPQIDFGKSQSQSDHLNEIARELPGTNRSRSDE
jgi:hypothetical protein